MTTQFSSLLYLHPSGPLQTAFIPTKQNCTCTISVQFAYILYFLSRSLSIMCPGFKWSEKWTQMKLESLFIHHQKTFKLLESRLKKTGLIDWIIHSLTLSRCPSAKAEKNRPLTYKQRQRESIWHSPDQNRVKEN